jgi:hypothetical protein
MVFGYLGVWVFRQTPENPNTQTPNRAHPDGPTGRGASGRFNRVLKNKHQAVSQGDDGLEAWRLEC